MGATPRLSIGLPVYNGEPFLETTLESLLGQTYVDFELIISDNGSTDSTAGICDEYGKRDSRIRYIRQPRNVGAAPNHNVVVREARGELFKWSSADDLCARDFLERCIAALDDHPSAVLAHSWTAIIDAEGKVVDAPEYSLNTGSSSRPERFRAVLETGRGGDDYGGVMRLAVLRETPLHGSHHFADRTLFTELALRGPFFHIPQWLSFRRDHGDAAYRVCPTVRQRCANMDPRRASRLRHPSLRLYGEYAWGFYAAIQRVPMSPAERRECYRHLGRYLADRAIPSAGRVLRGGPIPRGAASPDPVPPAIAVEDLVAGRSTSLP